MAAPVRILRGLMWPAGSIQYHASRTNRHALKRKKRCALINVNILGTVDELMRHTEI